MRLAGWMGLLLLLGPWLHAPQMAVASPATALSVLRNEASYAFADSMTFELDSESGAVIDEIVLRFQVDDEDVHNRRIPEFEPGRQVRAVHREPLPRGGLHPTAEVHWWWTIRDSEGNESVTDRQTLRYVDEQLEWTVLETADVRVWHHGLREAKALELAAMADRAITALDELVGLRVDRRIEIVAYQRQADLRRALADRGATYESRLSTLGARVADDTVVLDLGSSADDLEEVVYHELSHIVLHLHLGPEWVLVPSWLDEGLAMYAEGDLSGPERRTLDQALRNDEIISVRSLTAFPGDAGQVSLAYAQSQDLVAFLVEEHPRERFRGLLDRLVGGETTFDEALAAEYGYDPLSMYQAYRAARGLDPAVVPVDGARSQARSPISPQPSTDAPAPRTAPPCTGWLGLIVLAAVLLPSGMRRAREASN